MARIEQIDSVRIFNGKIKFLMCTALVCMFIVQIIPNNIGHIGSTNALTNNQYSTNEQKQTLQKVEFNNYNLVDQDSDSRLVTDEKMSDYPIKLKSEIVSERNMMEKHYLLPDGSRSVEFYTAPVHYLDEQTNEWKDIDLTIVPSNNDYYAFENTKNIYKTYFPSHSAGAKFEYEDVWLHEISLDAYRIEPKAKENSVTYSNFIDGADLKYTLESKGLKEDIVLNEYNGKNLFKFKIFTNGKITYENGRYALYYEGKRVMFFPKPYMTDANDVFSESIKFEIKKDREGYTVIIEADSTWLMSEDRVYPVKIDPSITIDMVAGGKMTYVISTAPTANYGTSPYAISGYLTTPRIYRTYIQFDISSMQPGYYIVCAQVLLYQYSYNGNVNLDYSAWRITSDWDESTVNYNSGVTTSNTYARNTLAGMSTINSWLYFEITEYMRGWYNGSIPNQGVCIRRASEATTSGFVGFYTDDYATTSYRPKMEVIYSPINYTLLSPTKDTYVSQIAPSANYGTQNTLKFGRESAGVYRSYLKFEPTILIPNITIHEAYLMINCYGYSGPGTYGIGVYNVTSNWEESTLIYNNQPSFNTTPCSTIYCSARQGWFVWDIKELATAWITNPSINNGILVKLNDESDTNARYYNCSSQQYSPWNYRPLLLLSYSTGSNYVFIPPDNDTYVRESALSQNFNGDLVNQLVFGGNSSTDEYWTFLRFPISSYIPPAAVITSAQLYLFQWNSQNANPMVVEMREVKSSWAASTLTFADALLMTYNASAETFIAVSDSTPSGPQGYITFTATESAKRWYSSPSTNYGVVIRCMDGQTPTNRIFVNSSEHNIPARRPILHVSYQVLGDITPPTTTATIMSGTQGANGWYVSNVNLKLTASDNVGGSGVYAIAYGEGTPTTEVIGSTAEIQISDGQHVIAYRARDIAGNWESIKYVQVNVDTNPPTDLEVLNILYDDGTKWFNQSGTAYYSNAQSNRIVTFELDFMDNVSAPFRIVGNNAFGVTPSDNNGEDGWTLAYTIVAGTGPLSPQTITATAYDTAGNSKQITMPITLVQDITGPTGYTIDAPEYPSGAYTVTVNGGTDAGCGVNGTYLDEFPTNEGEPTTLRSTMAGNTAPGTHYYRAMQVDRLGNKGQIVSASSTIGLMSASIVSITEDSGSAYMYYNTTTKKLYYSALGESSFTINIDVTGSGAPFVSASGSSAFGDTPTDTTPGTSPNVFSLTYTIEHGASFQGTITITLATSGSMTSTLLLPVELDSVAPSGYALVAPAYASSPYTVTIVGGSDTGVGLEAFYLDRFSSDSGEPATIRTSMTGDMTEGTHFYRAYAVDFVGNKGAILSNRTIVDTTAPTISIESVTITSGVGVVSSANGWNLKYGKQACTFTIAVTATDSASGILSVKGSNAFSDAPEDTSGPEYSLEYTIEANAEGPSSITLTATDKIGLSSNATLKLERDVTPPTQITGITATRKGNDVMLSWSEGLDANGISKYVVYRGSSKDATTMLIQINANQDADPAQPGIQYLDVNAPKGTIYYKVTAIDNLGNEASSLTAEAKKVGAMQTGSTEFPYWIIAVLVVVAVIAVLGFMMMRKKEDEKPTKVHRSYDTISTGPTYGEPRQPMQQPMMQPMQGPTQMPQPQMGMQYGSMQTGSMQTAPMPSAGTGTSFSHQATIPSASSREPVYSTGPAQKVTPITFDKSAICTKCKGIMKKGSQGIKCACGSPYHEECANRLGKCSNCSRVISKGQLNEVRGTLPDGTVKATLDSKCYTCNGAIKQGLTMYKCPCGYTYHEACALRIINCKNCGRKMTL